ncbi:MAG: hypothetical protein JO061_23255 [Acidobacteriaceae bacterium]|nr:hypothetical protein [Acidobacteriaceae bacterium]
MIRAGDYLMLGVQVTWIFNPEAKQSFIYSDQGTVESFDFVIHHGQIELSMSKTQRERRIAVHSN